VLAALTAIFAKVDVQNLSSDLAAFLRTLVVIAVLGAFLAARGLFQSSAASRRAAPSYLFSTLSGLATGAAWVCYFRALQLGEAARVAPIDKLRVVLVAVFGVPFLGEHLSLTGSLGVPQIGGGAVLVALG
jgi:transporter family protein